MALADCGYPLTMVTVVRLGLPTVHEIAGLLQREQVLNVIRVTAFRSCHMSYSLATRQIAVKRRQTTYYPYSPSSLC
jgi:hypothetical protein